MAYDLREGIPGHGIVARAKPDAVQEDASVGRGSRRQSVLVA